MFMGSKAAEQAAFMLDRGKMIVSAYVNTMRGTFPRQEQIGPGRWSRNKRLTPERRLAGLSINSRNRGANGNGGFAVTQSQLRQREGATRRRAEGFERTHLPEKLQFYNVARGSTAEVRSLLYVIEDNFPRSGSEAAALRSEAVSAGKLVSGLIRSTEGRKGSA
jgi:four helix bundle protein